MDHLRHVPEYNKQYPLSRTTYLCDKYIRYYVPGTTHLFAVDDYFRLLLLTGTRCILHYKCEQLVPGIYNYTPPLPTYVNYVKLCSVVWFVSLLGKYSKVVFCRVRTEPYCWC